MTGATGRKVLCDLQTKGPDAAGDQIGRLAVQFSVAREDRRIRLAWLGTGPDVPRAYCPMAERHLGLVPRSDRKNSAIKQGELIRTALPEPGTGQGRLHPPNSSGCSTWSVRPRPQKRVCHGDTTSSVGHRLGTPGHEPVSAREHQRESDCTTCKLASRAVVRMPASPASIPQR